jgi:hypothetical protein
MFTDSYQNQQRPNSLQDAIITKIQHYNNNRNQSTSGLNLSFKLKKILYLHSDGNDEGANAEQAWPGFEDVFVVDDENHQNANR